MSFEPNPVVFRAVGRVVKGKIAFGDSVLLTALLAPPERDKAHRLYVAKAYRLDGTMLNADWWDLSEECVAGLFRLTFKGEAFTKAVWEILERRSCRDPGDEETLALYRAFLKAERIYLEIPVSCDSKGTLILDLRYRKPQGKKD